MAPFFDGRLQARCLQGNANVVSDLLELLCRLLDTLQQNSLQAKAQVILRHIEKSDADPCHSRPNDFGRPLGSVRDHHRDRLGQLDVRGTIEARTDGGPFVTLRSSVQRPLLWMVLAFSRTFVRSEVRRSTAFSSAPCRPRGPSSPPSSHGRGERPS